jgi:hypothetical protein
MSITLEQKIKIFEIKCGNGRIFENKVNIVNARTEDGSNAILAMSSEDEEEIVP